MSQVPSVPVYTKLAFAAVIATSAITQSPASALAFGESCKRVFVQVENVSGLKIKIIDLDYFDYGGNGKWRSEPTPNEVVNSGLTWSATRTLGWVGAERTKIRIKYRIVKPRTDGKKFHKKFCANSAPAVCTDEKVYKVTISKYTKC